ncbi:MAG: hypothetical protein BGO21_11215 [Dyadobacter sp. 50-39]|uniref:hypothetical protein n=1 Tax=Dyadobacter sp. 50-39 TaxID=1895756 RepID=UPI0009641778|nr:hypothetical protein [Dyadobacter sp. 50-39]OJV19957.1 MAG: hypothetical protein BGO21_11215 [Dyadobacter sp. 50-39]
MKKVIAIGIITGVVLFLFVISCGKPMQKGNTEKEQADVAKKNKTEGYFYHQPEQETKTDSSSIRKSVNN